MTSLVVATFNVRNGLAFDGWRWTWPARRRALADAVAALDADVIGLQEVYGFQLRYLLGALPHDHDWFGESRTPRWRSWRTLLFGDERCVVLVRRRSGWRAVSSETRWFGGVSGGRLPGASYPRVATLVRLRAGEAAGADVGADVGAGVGLEVDVIDTHLDEHVASNRATSARELATWVRPGVATVVLGDFNARAGDASVFAPLAAAGLRVVEPTSSTAGRRIDHILVSIHWQAEQVEVVDPPERPPPAPPPSDHRPVVARLVLTA